MKGDFSAEYSAKKIAIGNGYYIALVTDEAIAENLLGNQLINNYTIEPSDGSALTPNMGNCPSWTIGPALIRTSSTVWVYPIWSFPDIN